VRLRPVHLVKLDRPKEVNRRLSIALIIIAAAVVALLVLLSIVTLFVLIDWGNW
jgi:hypothetical protein